MNELKEKHLEEAHNEHQAKELEVRRKAIELKKKQIEVDAYKELVEDTSSITDVLDFNKFCSKYRQFLDKDKGVSTGGPTILKTPGGPYILDQEPPVVCTTPITDWSQAVTFWCQG